MAALLCRVAFPSVDKHLTGVSSDDETPVFCIVADAVHVPNHGFPTVKLPNCYSRRKFIYVILHFLAEIDICKDTTIGDVRYCAIWVADGERKAECLLCEVGRLRHVDISLHIPNGATECGGDSQDAKTMTRTRLGMIHRRTNGYARTTAHT